MSSKPPSSRSGWRQALRCLLLVLLGVAAPDAHAAFTNFVNFETAPVHPVALGPDGRTLAICNLPDNRVEFFDVVTGVPVPTGSVPVGIDPVAARFASTNELWVVNHISSTISIINVTGRRIVATIETPAGPSDVVFAGNPRRAWISCSRTNAVFVVDATTRAAITNLAIAGERPRAMAVSPNGSNVYVAIFESGNGTTVLGHKLTALNVAPSGGPVENTNSPYAGASPPPNSGTNFFPARNLSYTNLPPRVSQIVRKNSANRWMDDNSRDWTEWVTGTNATIASRTNGWDLLDRDVAIISTTNYGITYAQKLMNMCMAISVHPITGEITVVGTDGTNEKRFESNLNGVFLRVNLALVNPVTRTNRLRDLNAHLNYITRQLPEEGRDLGLGDPRGIEWTADGTRGYITGMGSRNVIIVNTNGQRIRPEPIEVEEGPTGLAIDGPRNRLYVWNRFSSSISVVDTVTLVTQTNVPVFDPTPDVIRRGRHHLYDTRDTSGLGIVSCASCHVDARFDRLAWDLGDPAGSLTTNGPFTYHPMKGPMMTQTLQDIITPTNYNGEELTQQPLHWRGDRAGIEAFNPTFQHLQSRVTQLTDDEMADFKGMLASISYPPNFYRTFSNTLSTNVPLPGLFGRPTNGIATPLPPGNSENALLLFAFQCINCHDFNTGRGSGTGDRATSFNDGGFRADTTAVRHGTEGIFQNSQLRSLPDKLGMDGQSTTNSRAGFGFMHDGRVDTLTRFLTDGVFSGVFNTDQRIADMIALLLSFTGSDVITNPPLFAQSPSNPSQDVPAAIGKQITFANTTPPAFLTAMHSLALRTNSRVELVLRGKKNNQPRQWVLRRATQDFQSDRHGEIAATLASVIANAGVSNEFTATLVAEGTARRLALDRDGDGYLDSSELETGFGVTDADSHPGRIVSVTKVATNIVLRWLSAPGAKYKVEWANDLSLLEYTNPWSTFAPTYTATTNFLNSTDAPPVLDMQRYYRVRLQE